MENPFYNEEARMPDPKRMRARTCRAGIICLLSSMLSAAANSQTPPLETTGGETMTTQPSLQYNTFIDTVQDSASSHLASLARRVDAFFDDSEYAEEEADARVSVEQSIIVYRHLDPEYRTRVRASVVLPNLSRRLRLSFEGNEESSAGSFVSDVVEDLLESTKEALDDPSLRLQYLFLQRPDLNLRLSGGVRLSETAFYAGPRIKLRAGIGAGWDAQITQRAYWYTTDNLKAKSELRLDHLLGKRNLFRQAVRVDWDEERHALEGFRQTVTSSIAQPLKASSALRYAWSSVYRTRPDPRWTSTTLSIAYRQSVWRKWIFVEVAPFVIWEQDYDWETNPGVALSLSTVFEEE
jgi:hypothetical protein